MKQSQLSLPDRLMEALADLEHERWAKWHRWVRSNWTAENVSRWDLQAETPYGELSEADKQKDRDEVQSYLDLMWELGFEVTRRHQ